MKSKSNRYVVIALLIIIFLLTVANYFEESLQNNFWVTGGIAVAYSIIAPIIVWFIDGFLQNLKYLKLWFQTNILYHKQKVRLSMSYIFRIRVNDQFLLVKNSKWNFYQPVGGVYKVLPGEIARLQERFKVELDKKLCTHGVKKDDLRVFLPAPYTLDFLDWFESGRNREISQWREFCEELIRTNVLSFDDFPHINYRYVGTVRTPLKKSQKFNCWEILQYEVFDLIPDNQQEQKLSELLNKGNTEYIKWADELLINQLGFNESTRNEDYDIGKHTKWTLNLKYEK